MKSFADLTSSGEVALYLDFMIVYLERDEAQKLALRILALLAVQDTAKEFEVISVEKL